MSDINWPQTYRDLCKVAKTVRDKDEKLWEELCDSLDTIWFKYLTQAERDTVFKITDPKQNINPKSSGVSAPYVLGLFAGMKFKSPSGKDAYDFLKNHLKEFL